MGLYRVKDDSLAWSLGRSGATNDRQIDERITITAGRTQRMRFFYPKASQRVACC